MKKTLIALVLLISTNVANHLYAQVRSDLRQRMGEVIKNNIESHNHLNELRLDESQKQRLRSINSMFDLLISGLRKEVKKMKLEIELEKLNDEIDVGKINKLFDRIAQTQASIWKESFKKEQEIKSMLNEKQLIMHEKIINRSFMNAKKANPNNKR
tara:strand:+ start:1950 stop:2417 length:468 start_codon:yes stop_codon:yes gene_type:complete